MNIFNEQEDGRIHIALGIICFLFPFAGIVLYFLKRNTSPTLANDALKAALFGIMLNFVLITMQS